MTQDWRKKILDTVILLLELNAVQKLDKTEFSIQCKTETLKTSHFRCLLILASSCHQLTASACKTSPTLNSYDKVVFNPVAGLKAGNTTSAYVS